MPSIEIFQFPARTDNFCVLLHDPGSGATAAIDAPETDVIEKALQARGWVLSHILVTHRHFDHIEGIPGLKAAYDCEVIGPEASAAETGMYGRTVRGGDTFRWAGAEVRVIATPGHTLDHVSYNLPEHRLAFVGDTVFSLGCGRVIEGTMPQMWQSIQAIRALPGETLLYCGHEYTQANADFAITIDPDNAALQRRRAEVAELRAAGRPTLPTTIEAERAANPFLRADDPKIADRLGLPGADPAEIFGELRRRKDRFKG
jgi:hydroxyacylglutathione hydrolase